MKKRVWLGLLAILVMMAGCRTEMPFRKNVVSRIRIVSEGRVRHCTAQEEMISILNALRDLGQKTRAQIDPDTLSDRGCVIILEGNDGTATTYQIKGERYIRKNQEPWLQTAPQALSDLTALVERLMEQ